jgi:hypothetical protein
MDRHNIKHTHNVSMLGASAGAVLALTAIAGYSGPAMAVPAFADQTGDACSACHVGGFGPQLTAHGRQFKLTGYSDGSKERKLPFLSAMAVSGFTNTAKGQDGGAAPGYGPNNNFSLDQISFFVAGRIYDNLGIYSQTTWDGIGHKWSWDETDLRYGRDLQIGGIDTTLGVSVNNDPTVSDIYNTTPSWGFPFAGSALAPSPTAATLIEGALAQRVVGATVYGLIDDTFYLEAGGYRSLPGLSSRAILGTEPADGPTVDGVAPYWRLAYQNETPKQSLSIGTFGMAADVFPGNDHTQGTDSYTDVGVDASYQWHATKRHVFTAMGSAIFENAKLSASELLGNAAKSSNDLQSYRLMGQYYYDQSYGISLGVFKVAGSSDPVMYAPGPITGSANGSPNSAGYVAQIDWTPFGKDDSWMQPWVNLRVALQYTGYTQFNGGNSNYDGAGHSASDNNTLWLLTWMAF